MASRITNGCPSLHEAVTSIFWESIAEHLMERAAYCMGKLKACTPEELPKLQGELKTYETLLSLPDSLRTQKKGD